MTVENSASSPLFDLSYPSGPGSTRAGTFLGLRLSALSEIVVYLSLIVLSSYMLGDGTRYISQSLHPFWVIILLVTVQYGPREAVAAALLSSVFLLAGNLPEQSMSEGLYEYIMRIAYLPFLWTATALTLSLLRARQIYEKKDLMDKAMKAEEAAAIIATNYKTLNQAKERLEARLSEERCSLLTVYNIAKCLETFDPEQVVTGIEKLVRSTLNPVKFSIFKWDGNSLRLDLAYGWEKGDNYVAHFKNDNELVNSVIGNKRILSVAWEAEEKVLSRQGLMAGPIFDEKSGKVFGMLKIEDAGFMELGMRTHETFQVVSAWIARVLTNMEEHEHTLNALAKARAKNQKHTSPIPAGILLKPHQHLQPSQRAV